MPPNDEDDKSWIEYRRLILNELQRIAAAVAAVDQKVDRMRADDISQLKVEVAMLQVKSGMWGALAGLVVAVGALLMKFVA